VINYKKRDVIFEKKLAITLRFHQRVENMESYL